MFFLVAKEDYKEIIKIFLNNNININIKDNNRNTILDFVVLVVYKTTVKIFLSKKVDINSTNSEGNTVFYQIAIYQLIF